MSDADAIAARREAWLAAFNAEDIPAMSEFLTKDHSGMAPNQPQMDGLEAAQDFWRQGFSMAKSSLTTRSHDLTIEGTLGVDRFNWDMSTAPRDGSPGTKDTGECVWVWRRESDGAWRVAMAIWNSDLEAPGIWSGG